ncbi:MAG: hypothetical protein H6591_02230 [Flavobacteriales bacterium]|nr:hypothetical protein [Flavobacteriales bacterium]
MHINGPPMFDKHLNRFREGFKKRSSAINELGFVYKRLERLLPALVRRVREPALTEVLRDQHQVDVDSKDRLIRVAQDMGQPPGACSCKEANALVEDIYYADRSAPNADSRTRGIVQSLKAVRSFLVRTWGRLLDELSMDALGAFRDEAAALQQQEASQHGRLVAFTKELDAHHRQAPGTDDGLRAG